MTLSDRCSAWLRRLRKHGLHVYGFLWGREQLPFMVVVDSFSGAECDRIRHAVRKLGTRPLHSEGSWSEDAMLSTTFCGSVRDLLAEAGGAAVDASTPVGSAAPTTTDCR